jgi:signal peptidase I
MTTRRRLDNLIAALLLALLGAAWAAFAPTRFGGQAAYVIVTGISMEPGFHRGDLAILRQVDDYAAGDVVTYRHPTIGPVIHRIIGRDGLRFIFKGDNNSWVDEYHPTQEELIGKLWIHLPGAGAVVEQLRVPSNMAAMVAVMGVTVMTAGTGSVGRRKRRRASQLPALLNIRFVVGGRAPERVGRSRGAAIANSEELLFALATVVFAALLLGAFAFTRPVTRSTLEDISYTHTGTWSYSAAAPAELYDTPAAQTGAPIFRRLASTVALHFTYRLAGDQPADLHGDYRLVAEINDVSGWKRTVELTPPTAFSGGAFVADTTLDLARVQALIDTFERNIGSQRPQYILAVVPQVRVNGQLAGQALDDEFAPRLEFQLDRQELLLQKDGAGQNSLQPVKPGLLKRERTQPNTLVLFGLVLEVARAGQIVLVVLALALSCGAWLAMRRGNGAWNDETARIQRKYGPLLIVVRERCALLDAAVELATIDDLARLAERGGHMLMHQLEQGVACYFVHDAGITYCYRVATRGAAVEGQVPC